MNSEFKRIATEAALESGRFIKRSVGKIKNISYKGRDNIVTDVDKKAERMIIGKIVRSFPNHSILAEETSPTRTSSDYKWIIDPLDGTTNFSRAFPFFCVSIALEQNGEIILGVVFEPMRNEMFVAQRGDGAYLNGKRIRVSRTPKLVDSFLATGFSYGKNSKARNVRNFRDFLIRTLAIRRAGSAALDLCYVACGRFDGFWEMGLKPWDTAAGLLMVREAKGLVTTFNGDKYSHYNNEVLATNSCIHTQMIRVLAGKV